MRKILIAGAGEIGRTHAKAFLALGAPVALSDHKWENVNRLGRELGVGERYADYGTALAQSGADAVVVCTPNQLHKGMTIEALAAGCHVLCEKPMALSAGEAREMLAAAQRYDRRLAVGYVMRFFDAVGELRRTLADGTLGRILTARCTLTAAEALDAARSPYRSRYETGGGIIYDYTHELDYLRLLLGEPESGFCQAALRAPDGRSADDCADMLLRWPDGMTLYLHMDYLQRSGPGRGRRLLLVCERGTLFCDFCGVRIEWNDGRREEKEFLFDWDGFFRRQAGAFLRFCEGERTDIADGTDGLRVMELADALYRSSGQNAAVCFDCAVGRHAL